MVDQGDVRKAVVEAESDRSLANLVHLELLAVSVAVGYVEASWGVGIGTFVVLFIIFMIPYVRVLAYLAASLCWAILVVRLVDGPAAFRSGSPEVSDTGMFLALFAFVASLMAHFAFRRHMVDTTRPTAKGQQEAAAPRSETTQASATLVTDERECPMCAEMIKVKAKKCRYCGSDVEPVSARQPHELDAVAVSAGIPGPTLMSSILSHDEAPAAPAGPSKALSMADKMRLRRESRKRNHPVLWRLGKVFLGISLLFMGYGAWALAHTRYTPEYAQCLETHGDEPTEAVKEECTSETMRKVYFHLDY